MGHFDIPSIFEICFSTFLAQPLQCMETLSITICIYIVHQSIKLYIFVRSRKIKEIELEQYLGLQLKCQCLFSSNNILESQKLIFFISNQWTFLKLFLVFLGVVHAETRTRARRKTKRVKHPAKTKLPHFNHKLSISILPKETNIFKVRQNFPAYISNLHSPICPSHSVRVL